ncbi:MAG: hypothetical protein QW343_01440, partial [Candidatus Norongarragalinales archaeon]
MVWKDIAKDHGDPLIHIFAYTSAVVDLLDPPLSRSHASWVVELRDKNMRWCGKENEFKEFGAEVLNKLGDEETGFFELVERESRRTMNELRERGFAVRDAPLKSFTNEDLASEFERLYETWRHASKWGHIVNLADFEHFELTNKIMAFIKKRVAENNCLNKNEAIVPEAFSVLTTPLEKNPFLLQDEAFFELLAKIQSNVDCEQLFKTKPAKTILKEVEAFPEVDRALHEHVREYDWLQYQYSGPTILDEAFFVKALASEAKKGVNAREKIKELTKKTIDLREKQIALCKQLRLTESEQRWLKIARSFMFLKAVRKDIV